MTKSTPVFFRKKPKTEDSLTNATYLRVAETLPNGQPVHEILFHQEKWLVGPQDIKTKEEALAALAAELSAEIDKHKASGMHKLEDIANAMQISEGTLRKRMKLIFNHKSNAQSG